MRLRFLIVGLTAAVFFSDSAFALSCMRADMAQTMETAKASDDLYYILVGAFTSTPLPKIKPTSPNSPMNGIGAHKINAQFDGYMLSNEEQYDVPINRLPVDIDVSCAGPWCGGAPANGMDVIAFVKSRPGQPLLLTAGPCPDKVFRLNSDKTKVEKLRRCFDENCVAELKSPAEKR